MIKRGVLLAGLNRTSKVSPRVVYPGCFLTRTEGMTTRMSKTLTTCGRGGGRKENGKLVGTHEGRICSADRGVWAVASLWKKCNVDSRAIDVGMELVSGHEDCICPERNHKSAHKSKHIVTVKISFPCQWLVIGRRTRLDVGLEV